MEEWRLLEVEKPDDAAMNLAIDEAVFLAKIEEKVPPTVRLWTNKSAVVIGYSQKAEAEVNLELCQEMGIEVVRRFSGGGAVYHDLENLNYSIALEADHPIVSGFSIVDSHRVLSGGVVKALKDFGIEAVFVPPSDLLVGNRKISGNAQSRKKGAILHHGTLLVDTDLDLLTRVLSLPEGKITKKVTSKRQPVTNLAEEIGLQVTMDKVRKSVKRGFEKVFSVKLVRGSLSSEEEKIAHYLYAEKYSKKEWNFWR